jgi:UMF1 family MFS transporter
LNLQPGERGGDDAGSALNGDPSLVPADHGEIRSWYLYDCASSPVATTVVTFWALLVTGYAKSRAASTHDVVEWRGHYAGGAVCYGECVSSLADGSSLSVPCGAYDASEYGIKRKFERPSGVGETCQWFPPDAKIPGSGLDFGAVLVYCNFVTQLACGAFLVLFGSLGDFGANRKKGLVIGWLAFAFAPLVAGAVAPGDENDPANADATQAVLILAAALYVVTSIAHLSAQQMYDAYLPLLAQTHPRVLKMMRDDSDASDASDASDVKSTAKPSPQKNIVDSSLSLTVSAATRRIASARQSAASELALRAPAMGFFSIVLITLAQLGAVLAAGEENQLKGVRWTLLVVGAWAVTVGAAGLRGIRTRPGQPPPAAPAPEPHGEAREPRTRRSTGFSLREIARLGARRTFLSVGMLRAFHPELLKLLCGQILSAITNGTMLSTYTLFVQREFGAGATDLIIVLFASSVAALVSVGSFSLIAPRLDGHQLKWTLFFLKALTAIWPAWMCFGFKTKLEMWVLPVAASPFNTNILPTLRSVFQQATPRGYEAALFSLCGVCTVAFTWIGSLIVGGLLAATGSLRWGLLAVDVFVVSSLPLFYSFDPEKARADRTRIDRGEMETLDGGSRFAELRSDNARE